MTLIFFEQHQQQHEQAASAEEAWGTAFNELSRRIRWCFTQRASHQRALTYLQGLMSGVSRKNGWQQERCREAHVPEVVSFATKPELAWRMLERTLDSGLPVTWVAGDAVYGSSHKLRAGLEARQQAYALAVTCYERRNAL